MENIWILLTIVISVTIIFFILMIVMRKKADFRRSLDFVFLQVLIPKKDSKEDIERERDQTSEIRKVIGVMEQFFSSIFGIYDSSLGSKFKNQDFLSCEFIATNGEITFVVGCPNSIQDLVEKQITSFFPEGIVEEIPAPIIFSENTYQSTGYLTASKKFSVPFRSYMKFESADPMNSILNSLSASSDENGNSAAIQLMVRPAKSDWQQKVRAESKELSSGKSSISWWNPLSLLSGVFSLLVRGADENEAPASDNNDGPTESQELTKLMEEKAEKHGFETIIRCVTSSPKPRTAELNLKNILNSFNQFGSPTLNSFGPKSFHSKRDLIRNFLFRSFTRSWHLQNKTILSSEEIATIFHFPHIKYNNIPSVKWQNYKIVKAPNNIPKEGLLLGHNFYRGEKTPIYMKREDRFRHFYVIGQTGTGKSAIFQTMIRQDLNNGDGLCVIDPHGSLIEDLLPFVPKSRVDDVVIFDPADTERPMGLNLLEAKTDDEKDMVALDAMNLMIKLFDEETFGPRIQDYFRNGVLTLMADPNGGALTDIMRLFTDDAFQKIKVSHVKNPVVKSFWTNQMAKTGAREKAEIIPYFAAKFGQFITNGMLRNIIGQTKSAFDFTEVMQNGKILFMNLSKGATGDINSKLLGLIIVSKIQVAALRRQKLATADRRDFFLYIDEFQNYVTDSIESILSEARKYRLSLNIAHQYMSQIDTSGQKKGVNLKDAVLGNVGTMMCYKIGAQDAEVMGKEMSPNFTEQDLVNIDKFKAVMKLSVDTQPSAPFSITPVNPYLEKGNSKMAKMLKQISRLEHGRSRKFVEKEIFTRLDV
jgi:hypothetical protein